MDSSIDTPQQAPHPSHILRSEIIVTVVVIALAIGGFFIYQYIQMQKIQKARQQMIQAVAEVAAQVKLTNAEKAKAIKDVQSAPAVTLSPEDAQAREAHFINNGKAQ